jgi:hypothetical protein
MIGTPASSTVLELYLVPFVLGQATSAYPAQSTISLNVLWLLSRILSLYTYVYVYSTVCLINTHVDLYESTKVRKYLRRYVYCTCTRTALHIQIIVMLFCTGCVRCVLYTCRAITHSSNTGCTCTIFMTGLACTFVRRYLRR